MKGSLKDQLLQMGFPDTTKMATKKQKIKPKLLPIQDSSFDRGKILSMPFDESDGIVVKGGYQEHRKHFVVLGVSENDSIIGAFFINSIVNTNVKKTHKQLSGQFPLKQKDYPTILEYDSKLDCSDLIEVDKIKILSIGNEIGQLTTCDMDMVFLHIEESELISAKQKKRFGFEDKS